MTTPHTAPAAERPRPGDPVRPARATSSTRSPAAFWGVVALLALCAVGLAWQLVRASRLADEAQNARRALVAARLEATLADAAIQAQQNNYELARQRASAYFTGLQRQLTPALDGGPRDAARQLLARRDAIITTLARNDPAAASVLRELLGQQRIVSRDAGLDTLAVVPAPAAPPEGTPGAPAAGPGAGQ